jgi:N-methylhydantoinase A
MRLDREAAERAIAVQVARPLQMSVPEAAASMLRLSNAAMMNAVRLMTTQRGFDPRTYALIAFGGAGGLHACDLAGEIGMHSVIIPRLPGLTSAQGILDLDVRHDVVEPAFQRASTLDTARIHQVFEHLEQSCRRLREHDTSVERWETEYTADLRYFGQISGYMTLPMTGEDPVAALGELIGSFNDRHSREFGYALPPEISDVEVVNIRATLRGEITKAPHPPFRPEPRPATQVSRPVYFAAAGQYLDTPWIERETLSLDDGVDGPAVISEWDSTTVVPPQAHARVTTTGDLLIEFAP